MYMLLSHHKCKVTLQLPLKFEVFLQKKKFVWCLAWISYSLSIFKTNELIPSARIIQVISFIFTHICNTQLVFVLFLLINFKLLLFENIKNRNSLILSLDVFLSNLKESSPSVWIKYPLKPCWGRDFRREIFDTASQLDWNTFQKLNKAFAIIHFSKKVSMFF